MQMGNRGSGAWQVDKYHKPAVLADPRFGGRTEPQDSVQMVSTVALDWARERKSPSMGMLA